MMQKLRIAFRERGLRRISVFWKYLLMMLCILLLALTALVAINRNSLEGLKRETLEKTKMTLERDCLALDSDMYAATTIPSVVEQSHAYHLLMLDQDGVLDKENLPVLSLLREILNEQITLRPGTSQCVIYLRQTNSICSTKYVAATAEDYFENHIQFTEQEEGWGLNAIRGKGILELLPVQNVWFSGTEARCLTLLSHMRGERISVMVFYPEKYIPERLGMSQLPEGTYLQLSDKNGTVVMQYPEAIPEEVEREHQQVAGILPHIGVRATLWIPEAYFSEQLEPTRVAGIGAVLLVMLVGLILTVLFSKLSVSPLRKLISTHTKPENPSTVNEIVHLDSILTDAQQRSDRIEELLTRQILARAMAGVVLTESDEQQLEKNLPHLSASYRTAILHTSPEINAVLEESLGSMEGAVWAVISKKETGVVFGGDEKNVALLDEITRQHSRENTQVLCGVSADVSGFAALHMAVRQARAAMPQEAGVRIFSGGRVENRAISWKQHERLYQSIFANDEQSALQMLDGIARMTNPFNAREVFYNVRFVIRSAAEEISVQIPERYDVDYLPEFLPEANIGNLVSMLQALFTGIQEKNRIRVSAENMNLLQYIRDHIAEYNLCAASVGEEMGIPERRIYDLVRKLTGMSFVEYLTSLRMKKAGTLLRGENVEIKEIASQCGYSNISTFYRVFKKYYGVAPGKFGAVREAGSGKAAAESPESEE